MEEQGWGLEIWDGSKGVRFTKGPMDDVISMDLLIESNKERALECTSDSPLHQLFLPEEDWDGENIHVMWWWLFERGKLLSLVKRLQMMLERDEAEKHLDMNPK